MGLTCMCNDWKQTGKDGERKRGLGLYTCIPTNTQQQAICKLYQLPWIPTDVNVTTNIVWLWGGVPIPGNNLHLVPILPLLIST